MCEFIKKLFKRTKSKKAEKLVYEPILDVEWETRKAGPSSWNRHAGLEPIKLIDVWYLPI